MTRTTRRAILADADTLGRGNPAPGIPLTLPEREALLDAYDEAAARGWAVMNARARAGGG